MGMKKLDIYMEKINLISYFTPCKKINLKRMIGLSIED